MAITACPHCHKSIEIRAVGATTTPENTLGSLELRAVRNFLATQLPGRQTTSEVFDNYEFWRKEIEKGAPKLSKNALARAVRAHGAEPWRNAMGRGWVIPKITLDTPVPKPAQSILEAEQQADYRETVLRGGRPRIQPDLTTSADDDNGGLPFI